MTNRKYIMDKKRAKGCACAQVNKIMHVLFEYFRAIEILTRCFCLPKAFNEWTEPNLFALFAVGFSWIRCECDCPRGQVAQVTLDNVKSVWVFLEYVSWMKCSPLWANLIFSPNYLGLKICRSTQKQDKTNFMNEPAAWQVKAKKCQYQRIQFLVAFLFASQEL